MNVSACMAGSLAAVLSAAQGTQLLLSLPDLHPAEMCVQTAWPLQGVGWLSQQACLPLLWLELPVGILDPNGINVA